MDLAVACFCLLLGAAIVVAAAVAGGFVGVYNSPRFWAGLFLGVFE